MDEVGLGWSLTPGSCAEGLPLAEGGNMVLDGALGASDDEVAQ